MHLYGGMPRAEMVRGVSRRAVEFVLTAVYEGKHSIQDTKKYLPVPFRPVPSRSVSSVQFRPVPGLTTFPRRDLSRACSWYVVGSDCYGQPFGARDGNVTSLGRSALPCEVVAAVGRAVNGLDLTAWLDGWL